MKKIIFTYLFSGFLFWSYSTAFGTGSVRIKSSTEVVSTNPQVEISAYPNPFKDEVNLEIHTNNCVATTLKVYDIIGVEKLHIDLADFGNNSSGYKVQIKDLPEGIYFCNIYSHDKLLDSKKVVSIR